MSMSNMELQKGWRWLKIEAASVWRIVRAYPSTLFWPLVLLGVVLGFGVWAVSRTATLEANSNKAQAESLALSAAMWVGQTLAAAIAPVRLIAAMVDYNPEYSGVERLFMRMAPTLMEQAPSITKMVDLAPHGVTRNAYLPSAQNMSGNDVFAGPNGEAAVTAVRNNALGLWRPVQLNDDTGLIVVMPIFVSNVSADDNFGIADPVNPICGAPCAYNATTRTKFWGMAVTLLDLQSFRSLLDNQLSAVQGVGFRYEVLAVGLGTTDGSATVIAGRPVPLSNPAEVVTEMDTIQLTVRVSPASGWSSPAFGGLLAGVVMVAVLLAVMMFAALVSRKKHQILLEALLPKDVIKDLHGTDTTMLDGTILQASTAAELMLSLLGQLLEGYMPDLREVVFIRQAILRGADLYQPMDLTRHIRDANLDKDVARNLMQQLGQEVSGSYPYNRSSIESSLYDKMDERHTGLRPGPSSITSKTTGLAADYSNLASALALILSPQPGPWADGGGESLSGDTTFEASTNFMPPRELEPSPASPRPGSNLGFIGKAIAFLRDGPQPAQTGNNTVTAGSLARISMDMVADGSCGPQTHITTQTPTQVTHTLNRVGNSYTNQLQSQSGRSSLFKNSSQAPIEVRSVEMQSTAPPRAASDAAGGFGPDGSPPGPAGGSGEGASGLLPHVSIIGLPAAPTAEMAAAANGDSTADEVGDISSAVQDDSVLRTCAQVRRPPRKVASALGAPSSGMRRRSLLQTVTTAAGLLSMGGGRPATVYIGDPAADAGPNGQLQEQGSNRLLLAVGSSRRIIAGTSSRSVLVGNKAALLQAPPMPVIEEVERELALADSWHFDAWKLQNVTNGHPLSALGFYLIHRAGLISRFNIKPQSLARLLRAVEAGYNDNPYHNATHAADVLQTLHVIIHGAQMHVHYLDPLGLLAAYFAAIVHDYGHPGLTNDFLVATSDPLAVRYNDRSPLENHHAAASFGLLSKPGLDILAPLSKADRTAFRKQVIDMVLATDIKQHFGILSQFNAVHRLASFAPGGGSAAPTSGSAAGASLGRAQPHNPAELKEVVVCGNGAEPHAPKPLDETERLLSLQIAIKAADLGHLGEELEVHQKWLTSLEEEFFRQGDKERQLGIPISPLFDRAKQGVSKSQVGFYDFVALPLVHALGSAFPGTQPLMTCFLANYNHWRGVEGQPPVAPPAAVGAGLAAARASVAAAEPADDTARP